MECDFSSSISPLEAERKEPKPGDYVRGNVAEPDPNGQTATHEGVIVGEGATPKEWKVVDPGKDTGYAGSPLPPNYQVRNIHKEGAEIVPVPESKARHVEEVRELLERNT